MYFVERNSDGVGLAVNDDDDDGDDDCVVVVLLVVAVCWVFLSRLVPRMEWGLQGVFMAKATSFSSRYWYPSVSKKIILFGQIYI